MDALVVIGALLLGLVGAVLCLLLLVLLVPIRFAACGVFSEERVDARADASWGLGVVSVETTTTGGMVLKLFGRPVHRGKRASPKAPEKKRSRSSSTTSWWPGTRFAWRVLRRVARSLRLRARVLGRVGTGDPASTATVHGILVAARALFRRLDARSLRIDWMEPALDLEGRVDGRLWPAAIVWIVVSEYFQSRWSRRTTEVMG